jgi:hypothetical protein
VAAIGAHPSVAIVFSFSYRVLLVISRFFQEKDVMPYNPEDRWQILCRRAMRERDPDRLLKVVQELNRELDIVESQGKQGSAQPQAEARKITSDVLKVRARS